LANFMQAPQFSTISCLDISLPRSKARRMYVCMFFLGGIGRNDKVPPSFPTPADEASIGPIAVSQSRTHCSYFQQSPMPSIRMTPSMLKAVGLTDTPANTTPSKALSLVGLLVIPGRPRVASSSGGDKTSHPAIQG